VQAAQNVYWLTVGATVRTLPSHSATSIPPGCGVWGTRGSQSAGRGATWNGTIALPPVPVGGGTAVPGPPELSTRIGWVVYEAATPALVRSGRAGTTFQRPGGRVVRLAPEVAEDERGADPLRQPLDLLVEDRPDVAPDDLAQRVRPPGVPPAALVPAADPAGLPGAGGDPPGDAVQPARDRAPLADRPRPAGQDQERRLEGVVRRVGVAQDAAADAQDHRPVPAQQGLEGRLVDVARVPVQQLGVGQPAERLPGGDAADVLKDGIDVTVDHNGLRTRPVSPS
jgi:hypothetical protein